MTNKPEDLGLKIGSPEQAEWKKITESQTETLRVSKINVEIAEHMLKLSTKREKEDEETFRTK